MPTGLACAKFFPNLFSSGITKTRIVLKFLSSVQLGLLNTMEEFDAAEKVSATADMELTAAVDNVLDSSKGTAGAPEPIGKLTKLGVCRLQRA